jgi:PAS domain S-box-containing protein
MNGTDYLISTFFDISSRIKLEYNLKLSEEKFAKTFRLAPISLVITTLREGRIEEVNDAFIKLTKYLPEDIIGKTVFDINLWREPGDREKTLSQLKYGLPIQDVETVFRHKNGELHHYIYSAETIDMNGTDYLISTFFDITGRMKLENDLKLSEEKFAKTFRVAPISLVITTLEEGRIEEVNDTFLKHTGFTLEDTIGKTVFDINLWKNTQDRNNVLSILSKGQGLYNREIVFRHKNGELHNYVYSAETIHMHGMDYLISIFFDITERKKLEDDLRHSEEMYKTIFERTGSALAIIDHDIIILTNNGFCKITGYTREQLEGKMSWPELVMPDYVKDIRKNSLIQDEAFQIKKHEFQIRDAAGYLKDIYCTTVMTPGTDQFLVSFTDMTEYNYLIKQINQIATRERQRIGEVLHDNLIQYLTGISLLTRSLELKMKTKKLKEVKDIKKISNLIGESLHLTKNLMRGLCLVEIDEKGLPSALLEFIKSTQEIYGIPCEFIENNEPFDIDMVTASELYYIAREAIHNAVKHSNASKIIVSLTVNRSKIILEVKDNGKGLADTEIINASGMGLKLMKFRANMIGAKLIITNNTEPSGVHLKCYLNTMAE